MHRSQYQDKNNKGKCNMDIKKLLELAGVESHVKSEEKMFNDEICPALDKLVKFCEKQDKTEYAEIKKCAEELCNKLTKHLESYKK